MAGSHKSGILAADENLFENAYYIFTPTTSNRMNELQRLFQGPEQNTSNWHQTSMIKSLEC